MAQLINKNAISKPGIRDNNEDYILYKESSRIFVLCDGMGGHDHGEVASRIVAETVYNYLRNINKEEYHAEELQEALNVALEELNKEDIYDDEKKMGTTLVVVILNKTNVLVGHVGDSRCYLFDQHGMKKFCTKDHSKVQEAVDAEILTEEEAYTSPYKNILTRCVLAGKGHVKIDVDVLSIDDGDRLLLCSDGVGDAMRDSEIQSILIGRSSEDVLKIIKTECAEKSHDNFSAIILDLSKDEPYVPKDYQSKGEEYEKNVSVEADKSLCHHPNVPDASGTFEYHPVIKQSSKNILYILCFVLGCCVGSFGTYLKYQRQSNKQKVEDKSCKPIVTPPNQSKQEIQNNTNSLLNKKDTHK